MRKSDDLRDTIGSLIDSKKEGVYWDFKKDYYHDNKKYDLIHDVLCLANAEHHGDRYLIFGVEDGTFAIKGVKDDGVEKLTTHNITTMFRGQHFAYSRYPNISLEKMTISDKTLYVIVIKNGPLKPYYLQRDIQKSLKDSKPLRAGVIYSRVMDTNTPKNAVACPDAVEAMWKERFGLSTFQSPMERLFLYIQQPTKWIQATDKDREYHYYKDYPEFTFKFDGADRYKNHTDEWARGEIGYHYNHGNKTSIINFYYHSTMLHSTFYVGFDGGKKEMVSPTEMAVGKGKIYYHLKDSFNYKVQAFFVKKHNGKDDSKNLNISRGLKDRKGKFSFSIPVFDNESQLHTFLEYLYEKDPKKNQNSISGSGVVDPFFDDKKEEQNAIFYRLVDAFEEWKNSA